MDNPCKAPSSSSDAMMQAKSSIRMLNKCQLSEGLDSTAMNTPTQNIPDATVTLKVLVRPQIRSPTITAKMKDSMAASLTYVTKNQVPDRKLSRKLYTASRTVSNVPAIHSLTKKCLLALS